MAVIEGRERRIVGGVDTHKDLHVAAVVDEQAFRRRAYGFEGDGECRAW